MPKAKSKKDASRQVKEGETTVEVTLVGEPGAQKKALEEWDGDGKLAPGDFRNLHFHARKQRPP